MFLAGALGEIHPEFMLSAIIKSGKLTLTAATRGRLPASQTTATFTVRGTINYAFIWRKSPLEPPMVCQGKLPACYDLASFLRILQIFVDFYPSNQIKTPISPLSFHPVTNSGLQKTFQIRRIYECIVLRAEPAGGADFGGTAGGLRKPNQMTD